MLAGSINSSDAPSGQTFHEVFEVISVAGNFIQVRSAFLFELGEELSVRIEQDGSVLEATARVLAHFGPRDAQITELEIAYSSELEISYPSEPEIPYSPDPRPVPSG